MVLLHRLLSLNLFLALGIGAILAWPWWSITVPRWRRWALARGADPAGAGCLQAMGATAALDDLLPKVPTVQLHSIDQVILVNYWTHAAAPADL